MAIDEDTGQVNDYKLILLKSLFLDGSSCSVWNKTSAYDPLGVLHIMVLRGDFARMGYFIQASDM